MTDVTPADGSCFREGAGRLCLDFVRTLRHRGTPEAEEELPGPAALDAWVRRFGPCADPPAATPALAREARGLREAIHALVVAGCGAGGVGSAGPAAREVLNRAAALPVPTPVLDGSGRLRWQSADPVSAVFSLLARDALDLVTTPAVDRVRECADPSCRALFSDNSRPGNRRWCCMDSCGNRAKKRALRDRARIPG
jgi:predicted RNA-binding Zn ribbon-like protein